MLATVMAAGEKQQKKVEVFLKKKLSHLSSSIRCSSLLQEETGHLHLAVLCCHVQRTEPFLLGDKIRRILSKQ